METSSIIKKINVKVVELDRLKLELQSQVNVLQERIVASQVELEKLKTAAEVLASLGSIEQITTSSTSASEAMFHAAAVRSLGPNITKRARILAAVEAILKSGSRQTDDLIDDLASRDVVIVGEDRKSQIRNLSAYLSRAKAELGLHTSRLGWSLNSQKGESSAVTELSIATMSAPDEL